MSGTDLIAAVSIATAGLTVALGSIGSALGEGRGLASALDAMARQPEIAPSLTRTLFVGMAMVESTAIYCLVIALILLFANPLLPAAS